MPAPNPLKCDHPPSPEDYAADLAARLASYRASTYPGGVPEWAVRFMALEARRALHAERLLATIHRCTSIRAVHALIEQSGIPGLDATIAPEATKPAAPA